MKEEDSFWKCDMLPYQIVKAFDVILLYRQLLFCFNFLILLLVRKGVPISNYSDSIYKDAKSNAKYSKQYY